MDPIGPTGAKMGSPWAMSKTEHFFFSEITKPDPKLSKAFDFNKIYIFIVGTPTLLKGGRTFQKLSHFREGGGGGVQNYFTV